MNRSFALFLLAAGLALAQLPPAHPAFDQDAVHEIRLHFAQTDWWEQLTANFENNPDNVPYIQALFEMGSYRFDAVGVRFKGNSSYTGATTKEKPFRTKLNEFVKGQKIKGMASFGLSNAWDDPSFVREKPYYELTAAAGLTPIPIGPWSWRPEPCPRPPGQTRGIPDWPATRARLLCSSSCECV